MSASSEDIKAVVREKYGAKARGVIQNAEASTAGAVDEACCGTDCCGGSSEATQPQQSQPEDKAAGVIQLLDVSGSGITPLALAPSAG